MANFDFSHVTAKEKKDETTKETTWREEMLLAHDSLRKASYHMTKAYLKGIDKNQLDKFSELYDNFSRTLMLSIDLIPEMLKTEAE